VKGQIAQILLSAFLVFHVAAVFILPNPESLLFRQTEKIFVNYGNTLGLNTTWRFFSPNPMIQMLEYELTDSSGDTEGVPYRYPVSKAVEGSRESYNRKLNNSMYMMENPEFLREFLGPFLCKKHPGAHGLRVYSVRREFPTLEIAQSYSSDRESLEKLTRVAVGDVNCGAPGRETP
jgi:hypothetical protein